MKRYVPAMGRLFASIMRDERGGETLEYSLVLGFFAAGGYVVVQSVGGKVVNLWQMIDTAFSRI